VITVATWNVLHRLHAQNWGEEVVGRWPQERDRIAAIAARLAARTEQVIALQEVSGDLLAALRLALPGRTVHTLRYPRVPKARRGVDPLSDPREYLVLLVDGPSRQVAAEPFDDDPGKGALAVEVAGLLVVATHVSGDRRRRRQLARLAELVATPQERPAVVLGDFNTDRVTAASALGAGFAVAALPPDALPTRPRAADRGSVAPPQWIDHVIVRGAGVRDARVESAEGLSDHNLVRATIEV
jgi:endonuclease/exonuclease/phosphatase family metal-dependent hydrolase